MQNRSLSAMNLYPAVMPQLRFLDFFRPKQRENSDITADAAAVLALAKPSAAQDFRREGDVDG